MPKPIGILSDETLLGYPVVYTENLDPGDEIIIGPAELPKFHLEHEGIRQDGDNIVFVYRLVWDVDSA